MQTIAERLNLFIQVAFGGKVPAITAAMEWPRTALYKYLKGHQDPGKVLLDKLYGVGANPVWIMQGEGDMFVDNEAGRELRKKIQGDEGEQVDREIEERIHPIRVRKRDPGGSGKVILEELPDGLRAKSGKRLIPLFLGPASAGTGSPFIADSFPDTWLDVENFVAPGEEAFAVRASGDSMRYDGIRDGDTLWVRKDSDPEEGKVVVVFLDNQVYVKRLERKEGVTWLMPADNEFPPIEVKKGAKFRVWGIVLSVHHPM